MPDFKHVRSPIGFKEIIHMLKHIAESVLNENSYIITGLHEHRVANVMFKRERLI